MELNGDDLVKDYSDEIERMLGSKMKSVKVRTRGIFSLNVLHRMKGSGVYQLLIKSRTDSLCWGLQWRVVLFLKLFLSNNARKQLLVTSSNWMVKLCSL